MAWHSEHMLHAGSAQDFPQKVPWAILSTQDTSSQLLPNKIRTAAQLLLVFPTHIFSSVVNPFWSHPSRDADKRAGFSSSSRNCLGRGQSQAAKNKEKVNSSLHPELRPGTQIFSHPVLSPARLYQWSSVSYFKSGPWTHSFCPIRLLLYALLSLPEKIMYLYQELPYSLSLLCNCCLWWLTQPSKQAPQEKYGHLLFDNSKHPLELDSKKN